MDKTVNFRIYGDSLMKGTVMDSTCRYHSRSDELLSGLSARFGLRFDNRARFGSTVKKGFEALRRDIKAQDIDCEYALFEFGGNDCNFRWNEVAASPDTDHLPFTTQKDFVDTYSQAIADLKGCGIKTVLMTLPPIDAQKYLNFIGRSGSDPAGILRWLGDVQMIYRFHESYSDLIRGIARLTGSYIVDARARFLDKHNYSELICEDGLHPTLEGYKLIVGAFEDFASSLRAGTAQLA